MIRSDELRRVLDGPFETVRQAARARLREAAAPPVDGAGTEAERDRVMGELRRLAGTGYPRLGFPVEYGGDGDAGGAVAAFAMLAPADPSLMVKAGVQWGLFGGAVQALGTRPHHERYLKSIMELELPGCFAMTESGHGSDVANLRTSADYDPAAQEFVVHTPDRAARKDYIGNAARDGRLAVVFAQLADQGVHALLVPIRDETGEPMPGVTIEDCGRKGGLNGVDNGRLSFDHVRVPREALLNRFGDVAPDGTYTSPIESRDRRFFTMLGTLIRGRISVAGGAGALTETALTIAVRHGEARRQFTRPGTGEEVPVLDYRAHQRRLLPALATSYALRFAQDELVTRMAELQGEGAAEVPEQAERELESRAAGIKAVATWHATSTIQACREACGGAGYMAENRLVGMKADSDVFTTFEGDDTVLLQLVAKGLLTDYGRDVADLGTVGMARLVAERFAGSLLERAPTVRQAEPLDREWQLHALQDRARHLLEGLARRLRRATEPDADAFTVFNDAQDHLLLAARAHVDHIVLRAFAKAAAEAGDPLLSQVCDLHALSVIEADRAWFLEHGRLSPGAAKKVVGLVGDLCGRLRPHARLLVDAFGVPEHLVDVPVTRG